MEKTDLSAFSKMMALTAEQYGKPMSPELIRFYFDGLAHLPLATVRAALNARVRNTDVGQFMPKIADLIRAVQGNTEDAAYAALAAVQRDFSGASCTDPIALAVVRDMGGWRSLGQRDSEEWQSFGSKDFVKRYRIYAARGDANAPGYLPGFFERPKLTHEKS